MPLAGSRGSAPGLAPSPSPEPPHDRWSECVCNRQWQAFPGRDEQPVFRIERVQVGDACAWREVEAVVQRGWREAPVLLERESAGAELAAAEIEQRKTARGGAA